MIENNNDYQHFAHLTQGDITLCNTDVIVNSANEKLVMGRGVCGAIFRKAGILKLRSACRKIKRPLELGQAVITPAFNLPSKYIIHTASKRYIDGKHNETEILKQCYRNSIKLAVEYGCKDITFPIIGGGMYGFNINEAREIAFDTIGEYLYENKLDIKVWVIHYLKDVPFMIN